jgi:Secretion system C-terminal sorting domain
LIHCREPGLKQVDFAGKVSISKVLKVKTSNTDVSLASISPNPVASLLTINSREEIKEVHFYNANSIEVFPAVYSTRRLSRMYDVKQLSPGIYFSRIYTGIGITTQKVIVLR